MYVALISVLVKALMADIEDFPATHSEGDIDTIVRRRLMHSL